MPEPLTKEERENIFLGIALWKNDERPPRPDKEHYHLFRRFEATIVDLEVNDKLRTGANQFLRDEAQRLRERVKELAGHLTIAETISRTNILIGERDQLKADLSDLVKIATTAEESSSALINALESDIEDYKVIAKQLEAKKADLALPLEKLRILTNLSPDEWAVMRDQAGI